MQVNAKRIDFCGAIYKKPSKQAASMEEDKFQFSGPDFALRLWLGGKNGGKKPSCHHKSEVFASDF